MKTLQEIYKEVIKDFPNRPTDKGGSSWGGQGHTYAGFYDLLLGQYRHAEIDFLEIGVHRGGSLMMWRRFFDNTKASINGIDIYQSFEPFAESDGINAHVFDAGNVSKFNDVFGDKKFDIILDDGAHEWQSQVKLYNLHHSRIKPGGLYIIEDVDKVEENIEFYLTHIEQRPTIIDRRFINEQMDDVILLYRF